MFKSYRRAASDLYARRLGRTAFGLVLLAGAAHLVLAAATRADLGAARILGLTWAGAALAGVAAWGIARTVPARPSGALAVASLAVPVGGLALIGPLTLHLLFMSVIGAPGFDEWVRVALIITGPAHVVFAALAVARARALVLERPAPSVAWIYGIVVGVSCVPFVVLLLPPVLVALTGIPLVPILTVPGAVAARERALDATTPALAVARLAARPA